ncbi:MAG: phosphoribosylanthranilate isomerase [Robiginitomaculum sp.]|nr:MAG: phosphoribosylanthranilate isomerase [Robiginitomaculum sp.]
MEYLVKMCGLTQERDVEAAILNGANWLGFIIECPSPRALSIEKATHLAKPPQGLLKRVAVTVNASDILLAKICTLMQPDMLQLHGDESVQKCAEIKAFTGLPIIKALPIRTSQDLQRTKLYEDTVDFLLLDAKPPKGSTQRGGHGLTFDWTILDEFNPPIPYILAGGLTPDNIQAALNNTNAKIFDVASGIEASAGVKDHALMAQFMKSLHMTKNTERKNTTRGAEDLRPTGNVSRGAEGVSPTGNV